MPITPEQAAALEADGQDMPDCIPEPWTIDHQLYVLAQVESRPGPPDDEGVRWVKRRLTGKATAVCSCGYNTGLVDRSELPGVEELAAQHPRATDHLADPLTNAQVTGPASSPGRSGF